jgi:hypothetical protein
VQELQPNTIVFDTQLLSNEDSLLSLSKPSTPRRCMCPGVMTEHVGSYLNKNRLGNLAWKLLSDRWQIETN